MSRKADLSLSVNAIVILVLAIVIMAFALPFVNKMFKKTSTEFEALTGEEPSAPMANGATPITLSRNNLIMSQGDKKALKASVYNIESGIQSVSGLTITCNQPAISLSSQEFTKPMIPSSTAGEVIMIVSANNIATTICTFTITIGSKSQSISIPVTVK